MAEGLSDADVALRLVLSLHTVRAHLRNIYSKIGVASRSAATMRPTTASYEPRVSPSGCLAPGVPAG